MKALIELEVPAWGVVIRDIKEFGANGKRWVKLPDREFKTKEGETAYCPIIKFTDRDRGDAFSDQVIAAIDAHLGIPKQVESEAPPF